MINDFFLPSGLKREKNLSLEEKKPFNLLEGARSVGLLSPQLLLSLVLALNALPQTVHMMMFPGDQ